MCDRLKVGKLLIFKLVFGFFTQLSLWSRPDFAQQFLDFHATSNIWFVNGVSFAGPARNDQKSPVNRGQRKPNRPPAPGFGFPLVKRKVMCDTRRWMFTFQDC